VFPGGEGEVEAGMTGSNRDHKTFYFSAALLPKVQEAVRDHHLRGGDLVPFLGLIGTALLVYVLLAALIGQSQPLMYGSVFVSGAVGAWLFRRSRVRQLQLIASQRVVCDVVVDDNGLTIHSGEIVQKHNWSEIQSVKSTGTSIIFLCGDGTVSEFSAMAIGSGNRMEAILEFAIWKKQQVGIASNA
jgi:hypothetical protein